MQEERILRRATPKVTGTDPTLHRLRKYQSQARMFKMLLWLMGVTVSTETGSGSHSMALRGHRRTSRLLVAEPMAMTANLLIVIRRRIEADTVEDLRRLHMGTADTTDIIGFSYLLCCCML